MHAGYTKDAKPSLQVFTILIMKVALNRVFVIHGMCMILAEVCCKSVGTWIHGEKVKIVVHLDKMYKIYETQSNLNFTLL